MKINKVKTTSTIEKMAVSIHVAIAMISFAGIATVLSSKSSDCSLSWYAGLMFSISIPFSLSRVLLSNLMNISGTYLPLLGFVLWTPSLISILTVILGYALVMWSLSAIHGIAFLSCSVFAYLWVIIYVIIMKKRIIQTAEGTHSQE